MQQMVPQEYRVPTGRLGGRERHGQHGTAALPYYRQAGGVAYGHPAE
jgi:hypothetical protein